MILPKKELERLTRKELLGYLTEALDFLDRWNRSGSFLWYKKLDAKDSNRNYPEDTSIAEQKTRLFEYLEKELSIGENYHLPIVLHLEKDGYLTTQWSSPEEKNSGQPPSQIKITLEGILFNRRGGYSKQHKRDWWNNNVWRRIRNWLPLVISLAAIYFSWHNTFSKKSDCPPTEHIIPTQKIKSN